MALIKTDLLDIGTVAIHHVKIESELVVIFILRRESTLALIEQQTL